MKEMGQYGSNYPSYCDFSDTLFWSENCPVTISIAVSQFYLNLPARSTIGFAAPQYGQHKKRGGTEVPPYPTNVYM